MLSDNGPRDVTCCPTASDEDCAAVCGNDNTEETAAKELIFSHTPAIFHI